MTWMETIGGKQIDLLSPDPKKMKLPDMSHSLAKQTRFVGHTEHTYSVAEHSLWVWKLVALEFPENDLLQLHAVLHDAGETYTGDISAPVKDAMRQLTPGESASAFDIISDRVHTAVLVHFGLQPLDLAAASIVKAADLTMLSTEHRCPALMPKASDRWAVEEHFPPHQGLLDGTVVLEPDMIIPSGWRPIHIAKLRFPACVGLQPRPGLATGPVLRASESDIEHLFRGTVERLLARTRHERIVIA
jgi:hypothetical protein